MQHAGSANGRGRSALSVPGPAWHEAEGAFFLLGVVQPQYGIEPVEQAPELDDVLGLGGVAVESHEKAS